jgi:tetraacyldisaccharide 4'-kinase
MIPLLRWLLLPLSWLYGLIVWVRNKGYDWGFFRQTSFDKPVIVVGNLAVGGTGKSPMTNAIITLLEKDYQVAALSRGYGRKTRGFLWVETHHQAEEVGDEPLQLKHRKPNLPVAVCASRVEGLQKMQDCADVFVLDDAYQHRALKPGFSVLLFDYKQTLKPVFLLPSGLYRDVWSARTRAQCMVITKTPDHPSAADLTRIRKKVSVPGIPLYFASLQYGRPVPVFQTSSEDNPFHYAHLLLLTGIANPEPLCAYLEQKGPKMHALAFPDHHQFTERDLLKLMDLVADLPKGQTAVITTEKDLQRLRSPALSTILAEVPCFYQPVTMTMSKEDEQAFAQQLTRFCQQTLQRTQECL